MAKLNKETVALNLLTSPTMKEAAEKSGISEATLYRLRKNEAFQDVLKAVKDSIFNDAMQKAQSYALESLEVLRTIMNDTAATDSSRVSAARTVLELGLQLRTTELVQQEIEELKKGLIQNEGI
ncbi:hypothetical protein RDV78_01450 [Bacillota bacterium LX-D]|nr:hypothetical protein [Bacillota bacterium LX-D]